jgi:hypothetical protein
MEQTEFSATLAYKIQRPRNYPEESIQHSEHGKSLKSRKNKKKHCVYPEGATGFLNMGFILTGFNIILKN